jgi:xylulokinase
MHDLVLGIDIGTSSSKAIVADTSGTVVTSAVHGHRLSLPHPGWAEHDPEDVWWADIRTLLAAIGRGLLERVGAVCVSGIGPCLLPIDEQGRPLRPAILYGIDTRAAAEIAELTSRYGAESILASAGSPLTSQAIGPKLLWLRRHEPDVWQATRRFAMASSFAVLRLTGEYVLDHHSASQCDPLYDLSAGTWREDWAADIAPGLELPRLLWPGEVAGTVGVAASRETGIPAGVPVAAGTIDAWAEALSAGVVAPGDTMLAYGTTMFIVQVAPAARPHPLLWLTAGVTAGSRTIAAGMATSGALTTWLRDLIGQASYEELLAEAAGALPGSDGLVALPYFAGERTPLFDPLARGVVAGLTLRHGRGHLYRALLEATGFGVRHNLETIESAGGEARRLVAVGGGTRGRLWTQIVSDITGRPQDVPEQTIGAAYGGAELAAACADQVSPGRWEHPVGETIVPDRQRHELYTELYAIYRDLYPATRSLVHRLAALERASGSAALDGPVGAEARMSAELGARVASASDTGGGRT